MQGNRRDQDLWVPLHSLEIVIDQMNAVKQDSVINVPTKSVQQQQQSVVVSPVGNTKVTSKVTSKTTISRLSDQQTLTQQDSNRIIHVKKHADKASIHKKRVVSEEFHENPDVVMTSSTKKVKKVSPSISGTPCARFGIDVLYYYFQAGFSFF